ncbi:Protein bfr2 [Penicillium cosmopolitanum]|uniref:Protein BFR2 n=1 Tax=Penicillium cosmopolitanum TaxID=1131564 RepID=A0A9W9W772_9EURO|nr:Protein bfr2 [Penicillium cosmopolitanum]KAJ5407691.1 Protein bfr2 [Penicillium cosmopolitanum]
MAPGKSLADQLADLEDPTPKDFDPEDIERDGNSSDEEGGKPAESNAGREHYQAVGKGKLRKQEPVSLGKQYDGSRVSRDALDADSEDDPFAARSDDDEDSDELESDNEGAALSDEEESGSDLEGSAGSDDLSDDAEDAEDSEDEITSDDEESSAPRKPSVSKKQSGNKEASADDREELRRLMATDQKTIAATISQASKADAAKGKAVKEQRATFDALLNTRIKLQKGLTAINDISGISGEEEDAQEEDGDASNSEAIKSAESAALALWSTLEELRTALASAQSKDETKKRKRSSVTPSTTSASLWERMADLESESLSHRRSVLDKWSSKVRGAPSSLPNARGKLLGSASGQQTITAVLDAHVATEVGDRSSKRARHGTENTEPIYDDTIFYQSLLRELVEQRMSSSEAMSGGLDSLTQLPSRLPIHPVTGMRNDKVKRDIDTRASKGRKMKYNVHEKLQNFMAPEDRGGWTIRARDEFFASLLGRTASGLLGEGDDSGSDAESDEDHEEGGLQLFRS